MGRKWISHARPLQKRFHLRLPHLHRLVPLGLGSLLRLMVLRWCLVELARLHLRLCLLLLLELDSRLRLLVLLELDSRLRRLALLRQIWLQAFLRLLVFLELARLRLRLLVLLELDRRLRLLPHSLHHLLRRRMDPLRRLVLYWLPADLLPNLKTNIALYYWLLA